MIDGRRWPVDDGQWKNHSNELKLQKNQPQITQMDKQKSV